MFDEEMREEQEREEVKPTDWSGVIFGALLLPVLLLFIHEGKEDVGLNVVVGLGGILLAIKVRWDLRSRPWFWGVIALMLAVNVPPILMIRWPHGWVPGVALLPIALADCLLTIGAVRLAEKFIVKNPPEQEGA